MCIECEKIASAEITKAMAECFPLAEEKDLPWAACQIKSFVMKRIALEVDLRTEYFVSRVARVLCEASPPKTHLEDMARICVDKAKKVTGLLDRIDTLQKRIQELEASRKEPTIS